MEYKFVVIFNPFEWSLPLKHDIVHVDNVTLADGHKWCLGPFECHVLYDKPRDRNDLYCAFCGKNCLRNDIALCDNCGY